MGVGWYRGDMWSREAGLYMPTSSHFHRVPRNQAPLLPLSSPPKTNPSHLILMRALVKRSSPLSSRVATSQSSQLSSLSWQ